MRSYAQLSQEETSSAWIRSSLRIYYLTAIVCCGGVLFGYDSGVIGGVLTFPSFMNSFNYTPSQQTKVSSIAVGIQQAGALIGSLLIFPLTTRKGRRTALKASSALFCLGVLFEVVDSRSLTAFYTGRIICGLGIGGSATVIPIYLSEMSPTHMRARLGSCYQFTFTIGILVSYWIDYGMQFAPDTPLQWQVPLALQLVPGALMGLGMLTLPESVRWLLGKGRAAAAWESLRWVRGVSPSAGPGEDSPIHDEFTAMKTAVESDRRATDGFRLSELLQGSNARRIALAATMFLAQQSTGATAMAYFGPQFFGLLVGEGDRALTLLLTGFFGAIKVLSCGTFILFVADRFGRRPLLISGALGMAVCMTCTAFLVQGMPPPAPPAGYTGAETASKGVSPTGIATVLLIYLAIIIYNLSWGPLPWPCSAELFSTRLREPGVAVSVAAQWLSNFVWSFSTPYVLAGIGWATFLLFGVLDAVFSGFVWVFLPETAGLSLEEIEGLFRGEDGEGDEESALVGGEDGDGENEVLVPKNGDIDRNT
ncbi:MFS quinate transporter [Aspergillus campestris IBT 28561]|uniref:MFS quinate transporter n=1 Tax=Aspergillus campestris (strain IBT 28561) TaxID=1392248 RepID=A0A2I1D0X6_ASPC2|nr:MFS quinate transporter [Aspergillus campestris IBT 28561]PKY03531.1 MFS quinate transporter [Aspergillus campestris IBT 28561]